MTQYLLNDPNRPVGLTDVTAPVYPAGSEVLRVGATEQFKTLAAAAAASRDGDVILVDAGTYTNDFVHVTTKLTIIGVGGMVNMVATVPPPDGKAIMTVDNDLTLKNFTFTGAAVADGNGAGIRYEAGNMTLFNDGFYNNQNGILAAPSSGSITIDHSTFSGNGSGTGYTHNLYIGQVASLTVTNSIFENANVGHELKSRALVNTISNNLFSDGPTGTASYDIDLPNGGVDTVTNNVIEKGPLSQNNAMVHFGGEGLPYLNSSLVLNGNTFINDKGANTIGVLNATGIPVTVDGNTFVNLATGQIANGAATLTNNKDGSGASLGNQTVDPLSNSSSAVFTDSASHSVTLTSTLTAVRGGAGYLTVLASAGHVTAIGGSGGMSFSEASNSGSNQITTAAGSTNKLAITGWDTVDSHGNDWISTGALSVVGSVSGTAHIEDGTAFDTWTISGSAAVNGHGGAPLLTLTSGAQATVTGTYDSLRLVDNGGNASVSMTQFGGALNGAHLSFSIAGGSSSTTVYGGQIAIATASGPQGATIRLGDGTAQVTSNGHDVIWAGAGADTVILSGSGAAEVHAGTGALSVFGRGIPAGLEGKVYGNGGVVTIDGDTGNVIYYGGDKAGTVNAKLGRITLIGGAGRMTVNGGYSQTITGGSGGLTYNAGAAASAAITTASGSSNALNLGTSAGFTINSWGNDTITGGGGGSTLVVHGNATIGGGTGSRNVTLMGNDVLNGVGQDNVTVTQGATVTYNSGSSGTLQETGATVQVSVGGANTGAAKVIGGAAAINTSTTSGLSITTTAAAGTQVTLTSGAAKVTTGGADQIHAGSGAAQVTLMSDNVQIWGGSGTVSIAPQYFAHTGLHFIAGTGTANLNLWGAGGNDIVFGKGNTTVSAGGGLANTFEAFAGQGGGTDVITGFRVGTDHLLLHGVTVASKTVSGGSANLVLSDNTHIQVAGVTDLTRLLS